ncbi:hypothetical protein SASPL_112150 [Salvia splendens]|uniref:Carlactone synthase / all-trans-10'-apo-beta-carotenal 13,14-cleaving dioxygenase n=1 Tax=Salvia splendens TaxID=180675 RepID=A0A8X9A4B1_SALSN|nr:hypothetical protein SASPL_112150 [Salvia splendens]
MASLRISPIAFNQVLNENRQLLTISKVAASEVVAKEESNEEKTHVAFTSVRQERWQGELQVEGEILQWLKGTYLRNGPGIWHVGDYNLQHLFDGYAALVCLNLDSGRLVMGHRQIESEAYKAAQKNKKVCFRASLTDNTMTGVVKLGDGRVLCLTETQKGSILIDPNTLETLGKFEYTDNLGGLIQAAHPIVTNTEYITLLPDLINPGRQVVRMDPGTNERKLMVRVNCRGRPSPEWVHSFPMTENYVVVLEMPLGYCPQNLLKAELTELYKFQWLPDSKAYMHVMCKATGKTVPPFVTFHFINAYEETDEEGRVMAVIADRCEHNADPAILPNLSLHNYTTKMVGRFRIPIDGIPNGTLEAALDPNEHGRGMDMCSINSNFSGKKYRLLWTRRLRASARNALSRPSPSLWLCRVPLEKMMVNVVIFMVSQKNGDGFALVLDGTTFEEIARAKFPYDLPYGLHGCWVPKN